MVKKRDLLVLAAMIGMMGAHADTINHGGTIVTMEFTGISNVNDVDDSSGYGAVGYYYRMGIYEVMASQWTAVIAADSRVGDAGSGSGAQPIANTDWYEAARFCNWLTTGDAYTGVYQFDGGGSFTGIDRAYRNTNGIAYMLPSEDEWYQAAYYKPVDDGTYSLYASGLDSAPDVGGAGGAMYNTNTVWNVGSGLLEQNNTKDMMGNVWEWTEDGVSVGTNKFWGGAWNSTTTNFLRSLSGPFTDAPSLNHASVGFRVVSVPEPGTLGLMSLSTLGLFFTRSLRRRKSLGKSLIPIGHERRCDSYCTLEEWINARDETTTDPDVLSIAWQLIQIRIQAVWAKAHTGYKQLDKKIWNHMVITHEHRIARRKAVRTAIKKKVLDRFDTFLALIMK